MYNFSRILLIVAIAYAYQFEQCHAAEDLKKRQDTVSEQLKQHNRVNNYNGTTTPTFYEGIKEYEKNPFVPMFGFPSITPNVNYWYELNKNANHAKHNWDKPMPSHVDYAPILNPDLNNYIKDDDDY